jgi:hypothetical protein
VGLAPTGKSAALSRRTWIADIRTRFLRKLSDCSGQRRHRGMEILNSALPCWADYGTVFEIAETHGGYASTPATLVNFNFTDVANPGAGLALAP